MSVIEDNIAAWQALNITPLLEAKVLPACWVVGDRLQDIAAMADPKIAMVALPFPHAAELAEWLESQGEVKATLNGYEYATMTDDYLKLPKHECRKEGIIAITRHRLTESGHMFGHDLEEESKLNKLQQTGMAALLGYGMAEVFNELQKFAPPSTGQVALVLDREGWMPAPTLHRPHHDGLAGYRAFMAFNVIGTLLAEPAAVAALTPPEPRKFPGLSNTPDYPAFASLPPGSIYLAPTQYLLIWRRSQRMPRPEDGLLQPHAVPTWQGKRRFTSRLDVSPI